MSFPWVCFEDEHLVAVAKPTGINTHRADAHAQDGMYEWVQRQRPTETLSVLHRLDKGTSGLLLFGKSPLANRSLTTQFTDRAVSKRYELLVGREDGRARSITSRQPIDDAIAETDFTHEATGGSLELWSARPHTGRTHQVRLHALQAGMPILGDHDHHGADAARLFLHAASLGLRHPITGSLDLVAARPESFARALDGSLDDAHLASLVAHEARAALFDPDDTNAYVWIDRHHDGFPTTRVERLGDVALVHRYGPEALPSTWLDAWSDTIALRAIYEQPKPRRGGADPARLATGRPMDRFEVRELGARYLIDLTASATSSGLFLDQRETRRALLGMDLRGKTVLNTFAHTGSLSVAAALAGGEVLTLDLSKRYLEWAADNLRANGIDPTDHDAIYGDVSDWLNRFAKRRRTFDLVLVDPPSTSTPRKKGGSRWVVDRDLHTLVAQAARVTAPSGKIYVSTNLQRMTWATFLDQVEAGVAAAGRFGSISTRTLPLDHRSGSGDPPYLKAAWVQLDR